jgi:GxxExxY protein
MHENEIAREIVDSAIKVHSALGPGLLESAYERCLEHELSLRGLECKAQVPFPVRYKGTSIDVGYRVDLLVSDRVVIELKVVEKLLPIHASQLLTYLRLSRCKLGLVLNFNTVHMRDGIKRVVNGLDLQPKVPS